MSVYQIVEIVGSILLFISSVLLTIIILAQQGRDAYLGGAIAGGAAESFLGRNKARTADNMMARVTKILAIVFVVLVLVVDFIIIVIGK